MDAALKIEIVKNIPGIIGAIGGVVAAIIGVMNRRKLETIHVDIDGRMGQLLIATHAAGAMSEINDQRSQDTLGRDRAAVVAQGVADKASEVAAELVITTATAAVPVPPVLVEVVAPVKRKTRLKALLDVIEHERKSQP